MAEISLGKVFMTPKGVWDRTKQYQSLDIVMVRGTTSSTGYISTDVIPANTPISDKRWKTLFTVNDGEATADFNNKVNKVDANKKAIDTIYAELQKMYGVQISDTEPTEERTGIWVDTSSTETFSVPEIKDNVVNTTDTWSSQKINQMVSVDSYAAKSDACADDDRVAIYDSVSKTQKKALFGGGVWNWIVNKLTNAVISNLQTNNKTVLGAINELNSNAKYSKYSASLIQSQRIEESDIKEITFYKFGRLTSLFINISIKAFYPSETEFVDIFDIPDDCLPIHNMIVNYVTQSGMPMLFQIHPLKKKASVYGINELKNDWLIRQTFTYISKV